MLIPEAHPDLAGQRGAVEPSILEPCHHFEISHTMSGLDNALEGKPCIVLSSDMRVRI